MSASYECDCLLASDTLHAHTQMGATYTSYICHVHTYICIYVHMYTRMYTHIYVHLYVHIYGIAILFFIICE